MSRIQSVLASGFLISSILGYTSAFAENPCTCLLPQAEVAGKLVDVKGRVIAAMGKGFQPVSNGYSVKLGSHIMTGPNGSAIVALQDSCKTTLAPNQQLSVVSTSQNQICMRVTSATDFQSEQTYGQVIAGGAIAAGAGAGGGLTAVAVVGGVAAAGAVGAVGLQVANQVESNENKPSEVIEPGGPIPLARDSTSPR